MAIAAKDVYIGMRIVRNAEHIENSEYPSYNGGVVSVTSVPSPCGEYFFVETSDGTSVSLAYMDAYQEPKFMAGDTVRLIQKTCSMAARIGDCAEVSAKGLYWSITMQAEFLDVVWLGEIQQGNGGYYPQDFEVIVEAPESPAECGVCLRQTPCKPFALTIGTLTFDSLESLSCAITEGIVQVLDSSPESVWAGQEKVQRIRVKDGWVKEGDECWWHHEKGPMKVHNLTNNQNVRRYPELYSIKKPEYVPVSAGRYTGAYLSEEF